MFGNASNRFGPMHGNSTAGISVFTIDPGETTGWAWACASIKELKELKEGTLLWPDFFARLRKVVAAPGQGKTGQSPRFACGQIDIYRYDLAASSQGARLIMNEAHAALQIACMFEVYNKTTKSVTKGKLDQITDLVIEDFILREHSKGRNLLAPVRLTAGIAQEILNFPYKVGLTLQSPSDAKTTVTDERLKRLGLWQTGQEHARDANRHLALFLRKLVV